MATRKQRSDAGKPREVTQRMRDALLLVDYFKYSAVTFEDARRAAKRVAKFLVDLDGRDDMPKQRAKRAGAGRTK